MFPSQQQIQQHPKCIHVGCGCNGTAGHLLGCCKLWGQGTPLLRKLRRCSGISLTREQFGDAEIQQLYLSIVSDEDVGGLEIAMNDQIGVG